MGVIEVGQRVLAAGLVVTAIGCSEPGVSSSHTYIQPDEYVARPAADNPHFRTWCKQAQIILDELLDEVTFGEYEIRLGDAADRLASIAPKLRDAEEGTWRLVGDLRWITTSTHTTLDELDAATSQINTFSLDKDVEACKAQRAISQ
jgi:hypothetical protein